MDYSEFGDAMMVQLQKLEIKEDQAGEMLVSLLEMAESFRKAEQWQQAIECCTYGLNMTSEKWIPGLNLSPNYGRGLVSAWLATTYLSSGKIEIAIDYYEDAADHFRSDTVSTPRTQEESVIRMILSKVYVRNGQWGKALGAAQHSLNAVSDKYTSTKDDISLELMKTIRAETQNIKEQLHDHLSNQKSTTVAYASASELSTLPIYADNIGKQNKKDELTIDKEYSDGADFIFEARENNAISPYLMSRDLALMRPLVTIDKKEIVLVSIRDKSLKEKPTFMYLIPKTDHFCLTFPATSSSQSQFIIVLGPDATQEEIEPLYKTSKLLPKYIVNRDVRIHGRVISILRKMNQEVLK